MASDKTRIRRLPELAVEDLDQIESILDEGFICHVAYLMDDRPVVIPTLYARDGGRVHERALDVVVEALIPGRLADIRRPTTKELRKTAIIAVGLEEVSAKAHASPPEDAESDLGTGVWAGVIPLELAAGAPQPAPDLEPGVDIPDYLTAYRRS
ncbi:MAG TPA: pyridoxamine 5'-phosphate oxidase family protein [Acidimicrobiia bacterium]|nr:pyridoxamine 5'-phosphate oxidase family protein [Acidimicrobiia bacterium]